MLLSILFLSCSIKEKHDILKFFFDGVPPLGQNNNRDGLPNADFRATSQVPEGPVWYVHEPRKDCTNCHDKNKQRSMPGQTFLKVTIPELCYQCHSNYTKSYRYVHGPVAVGQCLYCHNPHASKIKALLIEPEPQLCYRCHDQFSIELVPAHFSKRMSMCSVCHNPHASSISTLLRVEPERIAELYNGRSLERTDLIPIDQQDSENMLQIFSDVNKLIENGDLRKARQHLLQFKDNPTLSVQEREKISEILKKMDETNPGTEVQNNQSSSRGQEIADLYYRSLQLYRRGDLVEARDGFTRVLKSGSIPPEMERTIRGYLSDIENRLSNQNK